MGACAPQDPALYGNPVSTPGVLAIEASAENIELNPLTNDFDDVLLTVSWNEAAPRGPYDSIFYVFKADVADNLFAKAFRQEIAPGQFERRLTYRELDSLLVDKWRVELGSAVGLDLRIIARVKGPKFIYPEVSTTRVNVKVFKPDPKPLYIIGSVVEGLDSVNTLVSTGKGIPYALRLTEVVPGREYTYSGNLAAGDFIFVTDSTDATSLLPAYLKGTAADAIVERTAAAPTAGTSFTTGSKGRYNITVRTDRRTAEIYRPMMVGSVEWARTNVDSKGAFAAKPDEPGKMYQFHSETAYTPTDPIDPAWQVSDVPDELWPAAQRPCPTGWDLPLGSSATSELDSLATKTPHSWAAANTGRGNAVAGMFFGPDAATATLDNMGEAIFIPAAGWRDATSGELKDAGKVGYVMSYTPWYGETSAILSFSETEVVVNRKRLTDTNALNFVVGTAGSVRCVKKQ
jgi:hypothetical protein